MKEIITYEELRKITFQAWLSVNDIMKITSSSKRAAYKIKNTIKEDLLKKVITYLMHYYLQEKY